LVKALPGVKIQLADLLQKSTVRELVEWLEGMESVKQVMAKKNQGASAAPVVSLAQIIIEAMKEVTDDDVTLDTTFSDLNLDSLNMNSLRESLVKALPGVKIQLADLLQKSTVRELVEWLEGMESVKQLMAKKNQGALMSAGDGDNQPFKPEEMYAADQYKYNDADPQLAQFAPPADACELPYWFSVMWAVFIALMGMIYVAMAFLAGMTVSQTLIPPSELMTSVLYMPFEDQVIHTCRVTLSFVALLQVFQSVMFVQFLPIKWMVLGCVQPGCHKKSSWFYHRWLLCYYLDYIRKIGKGTFAGPFGVLCQNMMGARVGFTSTYVDFLGPEYDLLTVGNHVKMGLDSPVTCHRLFSDPKYGVILELGRVTIGSNTFIDMRVEVLHNVEIGERSYLAANSCVLSGSRLAPGRRWEGVPVKDQGESGAQSGYRCWSVVEDLIVYFVECGVLQFTANIGFMYIIVANLSAGLIICGFLGNLAMQFMLSFFWKWVLHGRTEAGTEYPNSLWFKLKTALVQQCIKAPFNTVTFLLMHTPLQFPICWCFGAKVKFSAHAIWCEDVCPNFLFADMLSVEAHCEISRVQFDQAKPLWNGIGVTWLVAPIHLGKGAEVGLHSYVGAGCTIGDGSSVGGCTYVAADTVVPARTTVVGGAPLISLSKKATDMVVRDSSTLQWLARVYFSCMFRLIIVGMIFAPSFIAVVELMKVLKGEDSVWKILQVNAGYVDKAIVNLQFVGIFIPLFNVCHILSLSIMLRILGNLHVGEMAREDCSILVYHTDIIMQTLLWYKLPLICMFPHGTWMFNLVVRLFGTQLSICGEDSPVIFGHLADHNQITIADRTVVNKLAKVIGHIFERNCMVWSPVIVGEGCTVEGQMMANHEMQGYTYLAPKSTPMRDPCFNPGYLKAIGDKEGEMLPQEEKEQMEILFYCGSPLKEYEQVHVDWYKEQSYKIPSSAEEPNEKTGLLESVTVQ